MRTKKTIATFLSVVVIGPVAAVVGEPPAPASAAAPCDAVSYGYDAAGRLAGAADPDGRAVRYGYDAVGNTTAVENLGAPAVSVRALVPAHGPAGTPVTITGGCFSATPAQNEVRFNGEPATVTSASPYRLVATVPAGATTGAVTVSVAGQTATGPEPFTVDSGPAGPSIAAVSPAVVAAGGTLTVTGAGFAAERIHNSVTIGQVAAATQAAAAGSLTVQAPLSASSGRLRVRTPTGRADSTTDVFVAPSPYAATDVVYTGRTAVGTARTVTIGTAGDIGMLLVDLAEGQRVSTTLSAGTFPSCGFAAKLLDPYGRRISEVSCLSTTGYLDSVTARVAGTYTLLITAGGTVTGAVTALFTQVTADVTAATTAGGAPVTLTTTAPGQNAVVTFPGTAGQRVAAMISGTSFNNYDRANAYLRRPDGVVMSRLTCGTGCFFEAAVLPVEGTYSLVYDLTGTNAGPMTAQVYAVPPDVAASTTPGGDPVRVTTVAGQNAVVSFPGTAGQRISVNFTASAYPGFYGAMTAVLRRPDGSTITSAWCNTGCFFDTTALPADGTYTVVVDPATKEIGAITLQVYAVPADPTPVLTPGGDPVAVTLTTPGQNAVLSFAGTAGQRIAVRLEGGAFGGSNNVDAYLRRPDGTTLASKWPCGVECFIDTLALPVDGTYTVLVNPAGPLTGSVQVRVYQVPADLTGTITPGGDPVTVTVAAPGQNAVLSFAATAGQRVSVKFSGGTFNPYYTLDAYLRRPDGSTITSAWCGTTCYFDAATLTVDGTYTLLLNPATYYTGSVTVRMNAVPPDDAATAVVDGPPVTVTATVPGQNMLVSFAGTAGQRVSIRFTGGTFATYYAVEAYLRRPDGSTITSAYCGTTCFFDATVLPVDGTYSLFINAGGENLGSVTVQLYGVPPDAAAATTVNGAAVTVTTTVMGQNAVVSFPGTAGQAVTVRCTAGTYGANHYVTAYLRRPDGTTLASGWCGISGNLATVTLPVAGTYTILVNPDSTNLGSSTVAVTSTTAAAAVTAAAPAVLSAPAVSAQERALQRRPRAAAPPPDRSETWVPDRFNLAGADWRSHRADAQAKTGRPALPAPAGSTGVSGEVLLLNGGPLPGATLHIGRRAVRSDDTGRFLLTGLAAGHHVLVIDGSTANTPGRSFGRYEVGVDVSAGRVQALPYPIWMTRLDTAHAVRIPSPTTKAQTVLTTPLIPGFEVRLPRGSVVTDRQGKPVTELSITPIPVDQPPFPLPHGVQTPAYFTVQPGGAVILPKGAQVVYPNTQGLAPGTRLDFWDYDPQRVPCRPAPVKSYPRKTAARPATAPPACAATGAEAGWYVYGRGTVSADGKQVVPDPGVRVWEFTGAMFNGSGMRPAGEGPDEDGASGGDPVDLGSGLFVETHTDLVVPDVMPISVTRTYRPQDAAMRAFGLGTNFTYGVFLHSQHEYTEVDLVFPDSAKVHYVRTSPGTSWSDAVFGAVDTTGPFRNSTIRWNGNGWDLASADGTTYVFGENAPLQAIRDRNGNQITITRSSGGQSGNITQITSPGGRWIRLSYDSGNRVVQATDSGGRIVRYAYDARGRLTQVTTPGGRATGYGYDASDRMTTITDPRGITYLTNSYDAAGRVQTQALADGSTYQFAYTTDASGAVTKAAVTDPEGVVSETEFDARGRMVAQTLAAGTPLQRRATVARDPSTHQPATITDPYGRVTTYAYDERGNPVEVTERAGTPDARTVRFSYGGWYDQPLTVTDPLGHTTRYTYDPAGNLTAVTDPAGRTSRSGYDGAGQRTTYTDPLGNITTYTYDAGDLVAATDPLGRTLRAHLDAVGRPVAVTDPMGATTSVRYGPDNEVLSATDPLGGTTTYAYDGNGNLVRLVDARGNDSAFTYDAQDRTATAVDALGNTARYAYDRLGRLTGFTDRRGTVAAFGYDALGRTTRARYGVDGATQESTVDYRYDAVDRLSEVDDTSGGLLRYGYDAYDRVVAETGPDGTVGYRYDAADRRVELTVPGQPPVSYAYDDSGLVTSVAQGAATVAWQHDGAGRATRISRPGAVATYAYDAANQLSAIAYTTPDGDGIGDLRYGYDPSGRIEQITGSLAQVTIPASGPSVSYDADNRMTSRGGQALTYDAEGNLTGDGASAYTWNARGQLATADDVTYTYDAVGRRASRTVAGATTRYQYDGTNLVRELTGAGGIARWTGGPDQTLRRGSGADARTPITDHLGSTLALTDPDGQIVTRYGYDPYGAVTASGADDTNTQQYAGREYDADAGLLHNRARDYSPALGRFLSQDPIGLSGGTTNLYNYAYSDPINLSDPDGLCPVCGAVLLAGGAGVLEGFLIAKLTGRKYTWGDAATDFLLGAAFSGLGAGAGALLRRGGGALRRLASAAPCNCFPAGTTVSTEDGAEPIEDVEVGDKVWARDLDTGENRLRTVTGLFQRPAEELLTISTGDATVQVTPQHPFWVPDRGWVAAGELKAGDRLLSRDGTTRAITAISRRTAQVTVYNFEVAGDHNYYVTDGQLLVHNCGGLVKKTVRELLDARPSHTLDPSKGNRLRGLDDDDLLRSFNQPSSGEHVLLRDDGLIGQGHHRINEIIRRAGDPKSSITLDTKVTVDTYIWDKSMFPNLSK
ncbi:RHS repeat-associated core domain-containing protein [Phytohabitans rumicis]|uniref:Hint domain-containing protein n=1 Tax=Phytohabitans rumicis TaxID=1076125 RepID=A0A6V8LR24_9ACTN|nr:RHS repeat-associated core domain-containing protein [Phytohabitans rumicis]GFJ95185.1 hypothetical protein Prum_088270 [Phytohabitans rumicis]